METGLSRISYYRGTKECCDQCGRIFQEGEKVFEVARHDGLFCFSSMNEWGCMDDYMFRPYYLFQRVVLVFPRPVRFSASIVQVLPESALAVYQRPVQTFKKKYSVLETLWWIFRGITMGFP